MDALSEYNPFVIQVKISDKEKNASKFDEEIDRIKKLFGEDIVITNDD